MHEEFVKYGSPIIKLIEELSEVTKVLCKGNRFGFDDANPLKENSKTNREKYFEEKEDVLRAMDTFESWLSEQKNDQKRPKYKCGDVVRLKEEIHNTETISKANIAVIASVYPKTKETEEFIYLVDCGDTGQWSVKESEISCLFNKLIPLKKDSYEEMLIAYDSHAQKPYISSRSNKPTIEHYQCSNCKNCDYPGRQGGDGQCMNDGAERYKRYLTKDGILETNGSDRTAEVHIFCKRFDYTEETKKDAWQY
jgi:hypothetical protein